MKREGEKYDASPCEGRAPAWASPSWPYFLPPHKANKEWGLKIKTGELKEMALKVLCWQFFEMEALARKFSEIGGGGAPNPRENLAPHPLPQARNGHRGDHATKSKHVLFGKLSGVRPPVTIPGLWQWTECHVSTGDRQGASSNDSLVMALRW
jgi:hypothetical protein